MERPTARKTSYMRRIAFLGLMLVLLLAVLSTATFAWYSANNVVGSGIITFKSSSSDVGGFLTIGKTKTATDTEITFDKTGDISPMIPTADGVIGTTKFGQFMQFQKTYEGLNDLGQLVAKLDGTATTPLLLAIDNQKYFYINNIDPQNSIGVKAEYTIVGELADKLHIAMFVGEREEDAVLLGIMSGSGTIHYGSIRLGEAVADKPTMQNAYKTTGSITFTVPSNGSVCIRLAVWLDGVDMKNEHGSKDTSFSLTFGEAIQ
ncbi:MAG: hypothetical protein NC037_00890 [Bacteroides sp.]|nr:hypothetical protein [Bacillota bacterium]MCM1393768.1 hypothetical protein [[Eubacterium] siraeum]MCM1455075.1 hypothetical protein [Bacteroides sp.]